MKENNEKDHTYTQIIELLGEYFDYNYAKTEEWLSLQYTSLGGLSPMDYIALGYEDKLLKFIKTILDENEPG